MQISFVPFLRVSQLVASNFTVLAVPCFSGSLTTVNSPFAALPSSPESSAAREEVKRNTGCRNSQYKRNYRFRGSAEIKRYKKQYYKGDSAEKDCRRTVKSDYAQHGRYSRAKKHGSFFKIIRQDNSSPFLINICFKCFD